MKKSLFLPRSYSILDLNNTSPEPLMNQIFWPRRFLGMISWITLFLMMGTLPLSLYGVDSAAEALGIREAKIQGFKEDLRRELRDHTQPLTIKASQSARLQDLLAELSIEFFNTPLGKEFCRGIQKEGPDFFSQHLGINLKHLNQKTSARLHKACVMTPPFENKLVRPWSAPRDFHFRIYASDISDEIMSFTNGLNQTTVSLSLQEFNNETLFRLFTHELYIMFDGLAGAR